MLILKIKGNEYNLPDKTNEIDFKTGLEIEKILIEYDNDFENIEMNKWLLCTLLNTDYDIVNDIVDIDVKTIIKNSIFFTNEVNVIFTGKIKIKRKLYKLINFDNMIVDKFADLDFYSTEKEYDKLLIEILKPTRSFFKPLFKNHKSILDVNYYVCKIFLSQYINWNKSILEKYGLINNDKEVLGEDQVDDEPIPLPENSTQKWGIYNMIMSVCDLNYSEFEKWRFRTIEEFFKYYKFVSLKIQESNNSEKYI